MIREQAQYAPCMTAAEPCELPPQRMDTEKPIWIGPRGVPLESGFSRQFGKTLHIILVRIFDMQPLTLSKSKPAACHRHDLVLEAYKVNFNSAALNAVRCLMVEAPDVEIRIESRFARHWIFRLNAAVIPAASL